MARKAEEVIIALLLENYYKITKEEIMELYLNLIEFAPDVYGIKHACKFYFDKDLSQMTLTETIVLSYIIPRPIHFYEALLQKTEQLKRNLRHHICVYGNTMFKKGLISHQELESIDYSIRFSLKFGELLLA